MFGCYGFFFCLFNHYTKNKRTGLLFRNDIEKLPLLSSSESKNISFYVIKATIKTTKDRIKIETLSIIFEFELYRKIQVEFNFSQQSLRLISFFCKSGQ